MGRIEELEKYAKENNVPIMLKDGINFLTDYIKENNVKTILEIGTAIGYSAIKMALVSEDIKIVTLEREINRYNEAKENIKNFNLDSQITPVLADALEWKTEDRFDLIFIDAAKAQSVNFFSRFENNLNENGTIITDNLNFHGLTDEIDNIKSRNLKALVRKINYYKHFLKDNKEFETTFYDIGDGISVSKRTSK